MRNLSLSFSIFIVFIYLFQIILPFPFDEFLYYRKNPDKGFMDITIKSLKFYFFNETCNSDSCSGLVKIAQENYSHVVLIDSIYEKNIICQSIQTVKNLSISFDAYRLESITVQRSPAKVFYCFESFWCSVNEIPDKFVTNLTCFYSNLPCKKKKY